MAASGPSELADCGAGRAKLQLASEAAAGGHGMIADYGLGSPTFMSRETGWNKWGARQTAQPRVPVQGNRASNAQTEKKPVGVEAAAGETLSLTGELVGETHRVLEGTQAHPLGGQHRRGPV